MSADKMREEFEHWANGRYDVYPKNSDGSYYIDSTADAWETWQASRASLNASDQLASDIAEYEGFDEPREHDAKLAAHLYYMGYRKCQ